MLRRFLNDERGATAIEYALVATIISIAIAGGVIALSGEVGQLFANVATAVTQ